MLACYRPYRCADGGWLAVGPIEPRFFEALCEAIGRAELAGLQYDSDAQDELAAELETVFAARTAHEWETILVGATGGDSCVAVALHPGEVAEHPQFLARGAVLELPGEQEARMPASPYVVDGVRSDAR